MILNLHELNENATRFLLYSYLDIDLADLQKDNLDTHTIISKCAHRAYLDFCRTLRFTGDLKNFTEKKRQDFRKTIIHEVIINDINNSLLTANKNNFDDIHQKICDKIIKRYVDFTTKEYGKPIEFHYGQVQKWLNMTLKYMWLLELWKNKFDPLLCVLHVPVDRLIIQATLEEEKIPLPCKEGKRTLNKTDSWSTWEFDTYNKFQKALRKSNILEGKTPIEWENYVWIEIAKSINY